MLVVLEDTKQKKVAQAALERNLKAALRPHGLHTIGFPGGNFDLPLFSAGAGRLWVAFGGASQDAPIPRYWNAFGVYQPENHAQSITVEINIPTVSIGAQVSGFFAEDTATGDLFLMHSGRIGGGRPGIGKTAFLVWSKAKLVEVMDQGKGRRMGIAVAKINGADLASRIEAFVGSVYSFKDQVAQGALQTAEFKRRVEEFDRYSREFSGKKRGARDDHFEYLTYHGDIVQRLYEERTSKLSRGEKVFNSTLIDLFVKRDGILSEVYEVKTGVGRQMLYTAIGQLVTHATNGSGQVTKFLVLPSDESVPEDLDRAISYLGIKVRRFSLKGKGGDKSVEID
ncbi:hypothetical protein ABIB06_001841 [Bradyrhizobium sp. LB8.2]|uniref:hypothetical protein n=1 Tax=unclassified Bradyrhizobium TaxID=2631580 RepID=UPI003394BB78